MYKKSFELLSLKDGSKKKFPVDEYILLDTEDTDKKYLANKEDIDHVAISVDNDKIAAENYNLSVSSYVEAKDTREVVDIVELNAKIKKTVSNIDRLRAEIDEIVAEIEV